MNSYLRMVSLAAALVWAAPENSNAAILTYNYQGLPLDCNQPCANSFTLPAFTGKFVIDEALLPGGSIRNMGFSFRWQTLTTSRLEWKEISIGGNGFGFFHRDGYCSDVGP